MHACNHFTGGGEKQAEFGNAPWADGRDVHMNAV